MTTYEQTVELLKQLSIPEKIDMLEQISISLKQDLEIEAYKHIPWEVFLASTYGILVDDPIERNQPLHPDVRDEIE